MKMSIEDRFMKYVELIPFHTCWEWSGFRNPINGYGQFKGNEKLPSGHARMVLAHRFSYQMYKGKIPNGLQIDHLCRNRGCVNPNHLEAVTYIENVSRMPRTKMTHCKRGHLLSGDNLYRRPLKSGRTCRKCKADAQRSRNLKRRLARQSTNNVEL